MVFLIVHTLSKQKSVKDKGYTMQTFGVVEESVATIDITTNKQQYSVLAKRQAIRINSSGWLLSREEVVDRVVEMLAEEARFLEGVTELSHPARSSVANLAHASELLRSL